MSTYTFYALCDTSHAFASTYDFLTSTSNRFICVSKCDEIVNLIEFRQGVYKTSC